MTTPNPKKRLKANSVTDFPTKNEKTECAAAPIGHEGWMDPGCWWMARHCGGYVLGSEETL
jgi:hypothetical protein